jgi:gas vesicle protein
MFSRRRWPDAVGIFAVGVAVGAALGVLFAPSSGEDTREFIADSARNGVEDAVARGKKVTRRAQGFAEHAREQFETAAAEGERAFDDAARHS